MFDKGFVQCIELSGNPVMLCSCRYFREKSSREEKTKPPVGEDEDVEDVTDAEFDDFLGRQSLGGQGLGPSLYLPLYLKCLFIDDQVKIPIEI